MAKPIMLRTCAASGCKDIVAHDSAGDYIYCETHLEQSRSGTPIPSKSLRELRELREWQGDSAPPVNAPAEKFTVVQSMIAEECDELRDMLIAKNRAYGNSALEPIRVFSKAGAKEQILVRLDDKLSRLSRGSASGEDVIKDILGYLILLRVAERLEKGG